MNVRPPNIQTWGPSRPILFSSPSRLSHWAPMHESGRQFLAELGWKISTRSVDDREGTFLFRHISFILFVYFVSIPFCYTTVLFWLTAQIDGPFIRLT